MKDFTWLVYLGPILRYLVKKSLGKIPAEYSVPYTIVMHGKNLCFSFTMSFFSIMVPINLIMDIIRKKSTVSDGF